MEIFTIGLALIWFFLLLYLEKHLVKGVFHPGYRLISPGFLKGLSFIMMVSLVFLIYKSWSWYFCWIPLLLPGIIRFNFEQKEIKFIQKFFSINKYVATEIFNNPERFPGIFHFELEKAQDVINTFSEVAKLQEDIRERNKIDY